MEWRVFVTLAETAVDTQFDSERLVGQIEAIAGFEPLRQLLQDQFLNRGRMLRWYRIVLSVKQILDDVRYTKLRQIRAREEEQAAKLSRYLRFVESCGGDRATARDLAADLAKWMASGDRARVQDLCHSISGECSRLLRELEEVHADYDTLKLIITHAAQFREEEIAELQPLLGKDGLEDEKRVPPGKLTVDYLAERQMAWKQVIEMSPKGSARSLVAQRAWIQYGNLLARCVDV